MLICYHVVGEIGSGGTLMHDPHLKEVKLIDFESHPTDGKTAVIRSFCFSANW
jgi:hypothetical protein